MGQAPGDEKPDRTWRGDLRGGYRKFPEKTRALVMEKPEEFNRAVMAFLEKHKIAN